MIMEQEETHWHQYGMRNGQKYHQKGKYIFLHMDLQDIR